jgi:hypothetical protein
MTQRAEAGAKAAPLPARAAAELAGFCREVGLN